jgi:hypothetical protein
MDVGGCVAVGKREGAEVGVAGWQAARSRMHPMRSFFIMHIKTQLSGVLFRTIVFVFQIGRF